MKEILYIHIHKGNEIEIGTKTFCKIPLHDAKKGAVRFSNRNFADCPNCLKVANKTEQLLGV
jgi:hypothetical protein